MLGTYEMALNRLTKGQTTKRVKVQETTLAKTKGPNFVRETNCAK